VLQAFLSSSRDYQILLDTQLNIVAFNTSAATFTRAFSGRKLKAGSNMNEYIAQTFIHEFDELCQRALAGEEVEYEHYIHSKNNGSAWFNFCIIPINKEEEIIGLTLIGTNINRQKNQEKKIRHQSDTLSVIAQLQSHQVRQPVTSILGLMDLIKAENYAPQKEYLICLEKATKQLDEVIQTIVRQSRKD
jgi:PAS domain S-box-containing protein